MKAWVLNNIGDIRYEEVPVPELKPGEVLLSVKAAGICGSDIPRIYRTGAHNMPLIPGHEFSGVVKEVGENADPSLLGKRVGVYPLIPCGKCAPCRSGHPETCRDYDYLGSRRDGGFAQFVAVPASNLIELPDNVSFEQGAMLEPTAVAVHAMKMAEGGLSADSNIAVCGLGTIGLLLIMLLKDRGYENIFVIGNKESQKERIALLGIDKEHFCNSRTEDVSLWLKDNVGCLDAYFECVGKNESLCYGIDAAAPGEVIVTVGNPYSDMTLPRDIYWKILRNQLTLRGTWNSTFLKRDAPGAISDDWGYVTERLREGKIHPESLISHRLSMSELESGFFIMRDKTEDYCKVMGIFE